MGQYVMGIDVGTTGTKAMVVDTEGHIIGRGYREYPLITEKNFEVEADAEDIIQKVFDVTKEAVETSGLDPSEIKAVSFSVQRASFFLLDENMEPLNNRLTVWLDTRPTPYMEEIKQLISDDDARKMTGMGVSPYSVPPKVYTIRKTQPELYARAKYIAAVDTYVLHRFGSDRLTGDICTAMIMSLVDKQTFNWCDKMLDIYDIPKDMMYELVKPGTVVGTIKEDISERTGLAVGTLIVAGAGDQQAGAMGSAIVNDGDISLTLGTVGMFIVGNANPDFDKLPGLMVPSTPNIGVFEIEGNQSSGATCYRWARDVLCAEEIKEAEAEGKDPYDVMGRLIDESGPGARGVMFNAALFGSGYPYWDGSTTGAFMGLRNFHNKGDMLRAVMEGITLESRVMLEAIKATGAKINDEITIAGGAVKSPTWRQIVADVMNKRVKVLKQADASIIGVAIIAAKAAGFIKDFQEGVDRMVEIDCTVDPIPENAELYDKLFDIYKDLYKMFKEYNISGRLAEAVKK
ncbi:MAG: hypothetical protein IJM62_07970 [Lachnospiraceae bacterium]|nr:hypothetical protein [Lachnospiraceae bacterium]